jgi:peroxiredoxin
LAAQGAGGHPGRAVLLPQGHDLRLHRRGAAVPGLARRLIDKEGLKYELLSDADQALCTLFDVIREKNMYGKKVKGIERSTFLIGADGTLVAEWRKVKADGHAAEVLAAAKAS